MKETVITVDSSCDMLLEDCEKINVFPVKLKYSIDNVVYEDSMNEEKQKIFYDKMRSGIMPKTSQINVGEFVDFWTPFIKQGKAVVQLVVGSGVSGTYNNAVNAKNEILQTYPDAELYVVDSTAGSGALAAQVYKAAQLRDSGYSAKDIVAWLETNARRFHIVYTTDDLKYLYLGGRLKKSKFLIAKALGIKPLMKLSYEGHLFVSEKVRGKQAVIKKITDEIVTTAVNFKEETLYVAHSDALEAAKEAVKYIMTHCKFANVKYLQMGATIGAHAGPGLIAFCYYGMDRPHEAI